MAQNQNQNQNQNNKLVNLFQKLGEQVERLNDEVPYAHNLISLYLREIEALTNKPFVNKVIDDFELEALGWNKVETNDELTNEMKTLYDDTLDQF